MITEKGRGKPKKTRMEIIREDPCDVDKKMRLEIKKSGWKKTLRWLISLTRDVYKEIKKIGGHKKQFGKFSIVFLV